MSDSLYNKFSIHKYNIYIMSEIKNLQPVEVGKNFDLLTQVPRPSGHLEKVQKFLLDWAAEKGVEAFKDDAGNIIMR